ncbi:hypothetical protein FRC08_018128 [Ceratobasidium sp. 394]|nr:hypothetical protein FRC08_018128 [Ceratobasidium sp. 394]
MLKLFICPANDTIHKKPLSMLEQYVVAFLNSKRDANSKDNNRLPDEIPLAVGMEVIVTLNVDTELNVANGTRGTIGAIALYPNEPTFDQAAPVITLRRLPLHILVKMSCRTRAITLPGLEPDVLPIVPASKAFRITMDKQGQSSKITRIQKTVRRLQLPITPAYAFADYQSQGQTISAAIVNIAAPPSGNKLTLFNIYAALSRSSGCETIQILQDFDEKLLMQPLDYDLL